MQINIQPGTRQGRVTVPPSKSVFHRAILCAALSAGTTHISPAVPSADLAATLHCAEILGAHCHTAAGVVVIIGRGATGKGRRRGFNNRHPALPKFDCNESGSTLRFCMPLAVALFGGGVFYGKGRLLDRPLDPYEEFFRIQRRDGCLEVKGDLEPRNFRLPGDISSQFATGLLLALPLLQGDSTISFTSALESKPYVNITLDVLRAFGIGANWTGDRTLSVFGDQTPLAVPHFEAEGDWSQAAFWLVANALGSNITLSDLRPDSAQGDHAIVDLLRDAPAVIDARNIPDLVPILAVWCALTEGERHITGAARLRLKESDRLAAVADVLGALGADIVAKDDGLLIRGKPSLEGGTTVSSHNDHRIAMAAAVAATRCRRAVTINGAEAAGKSYPHFWTEFDGCTPMEIAGSEISGFANCFQS